MSKGHNTGKKFPNRKKPDEGAMQPHEWTEEEILRMEQLIGAGLSREKAAAQMTRDFKRAYSKSSVICKINRLKDGN